MSANNSIAASVTHGDPDSIEDLSDSLESLIAAASKRITEVVGEMVDQSTQRLVTQRDGSQKYIPVANAELYGSTPDGSLIVRDAIREILMEDVYLKMMMSDRKD